MFLTNVGSRLPNEIFEQGITDIERHVRAIFIDACDKLWHPNIVDSNVLMWEVVRNVVQMEPQNSTLQLYFSTEDVTKIRAERFFKLYTSVLQDLIIPLGWHNLTDRPEWQTTDPLALNQNNRILIAYTGYLYTLVTMWNRYIGYPADPSNPDYAAIMNMGFDLVGPSALLTASRPMRPILADKLNEVDLSMPPVIPMPNPPEPAPQGIWSPGHAESVMKTNFIFLLKGDLDDDFRRIINKEDIPSNFPEWEGDYIFTTSVNHNGGKFQLLIYWREEGGLSDSFIRLMGQLEGDRHLSLKIMHQDNQLVYHRVWEVFPPL